MKLYRWILVALFIGCIIPIFAARADIPTISISGSITATGNTQWVPLAGQSSCAIVLGGTGSGLTITAQGANDQPPSSAVTITSIGASGVMSANGTFSGAIAPYALTGIRLNISAIGGGTETYQITCSGAYPPSTIAGSVTLSPNPFPVVLPTDAIGTAVRTIEVCPSAEPGVVSGAYYQVCDASGRRLVVTPPPFGPWSSLSSASPTSTPLPIKTGAGTLYGAQFYNGTGGTLYIGVYDAAVANVTLGATVQKKLLVCPTLTYCFMPLPAGGVTFSTAITYMCGSAMTNGVPTTGCGSATTSWLSFDYLYRDRGVCEGVPSPKHLRPQAPFAWRMELVRRCASL